MFYSLIKDKTGARSNRLFFSDRGPFVRAQRMIKSLMLIRWLI